MNNLAIEPLPAGAVVRGTLYDSPTAEYPSGDVLEVELPSGHMIDVGWDAEHTGEPFRIVVYREYFGDRSIDYRVRTPSEVVAAIREHAAKLCPAPRLNPESPTVSATPIAGDFLENPKVL